MIRALFKKQLLEVFSWVYRDNKKQKQRTARGIAGMVALYAVLFAFLGVIFYFVGQLLCEPLVVSGYGWLYWCLMGSMALLLGAMGSVFNTYASLYQAKDNDLLLSMPIPIRYILPARLLGVYTMGLMYELIVAIPALIVWYLRVPQTVGSVLFSLCIPFLLSVLVLVVSAVLGWVIALISSKLRHKNVMTVAVSVVFLGAYYFFSSQASVLLQSIIEHPEVVGRRVRGPLYLLYQLGLAAEGRWPSMLIFTGAVAVLFAAVYAVLAHSFLKLATANRGAAKRVYKAKRARQRSLDAALLQKELRRFVGSANYMLNCGLSIVILPLVAIVMLWQFDMLQEILLLEEIHPYTTAGAAAVIAALTTMNTMAAPSVSLEGNSLWLVQSLPVTARQVLLAKWRLHCLLTVIPTLPLLIVTECLIRPSPAEAVLLPLFVVIFIAFSAAVGLAANVKHPNLHWVSESTVIKQGLSVMVALFGGWVVLGVLAVGCWQATRLISPTLYLFVACLLMASVTAVLLRWLTTRGADRFAALS